MERSTEAPGEPWKGITLEEWISRLSPWPVPWFRRETPSEERAAFFGEDVEESEARLLDGNR